MRLGFSSPPKPLRPISSERRHFCELCLSVRPMAMPSPTLFICVVSVGAACGNFAKAMRGIMVTPQSMLGSKLAGVSRVMSSLGSLRR
jgi:hypothetical protein